LGTQGNKSVTGEPREQLMEEIIEGLVKLLLLLVKLFLALVMLFILIAPLIISIPFILLWPRSIIEK